VYDAIQPSTRALFESKGITYIRNYGQLGLSWQETFQTQRPDGVEEYCRRNGIDWEWSDKGGLRTRQTLPAVRTHPTTGALVWFNQAHLFHLSSLGELRSDLMAQFGGDDVPRHAVFGDGEEITAELLQEVRAAYERHAVSVAWKQNDLLILDNMLWAHGRRPYSGPRRVLVAMTGMSRG
jgi:hypothetical protein